MAKKKNSKPKQNDLKYFKKDMLKSLVWTVVIVGLLFGVKWYLDWGGSTLINDLRFMNKCNFLEV